MAALWGYRAFWLLMGVAAVAVLGYAVFPRLSSFAGPAMFLVLAAAWFCIILCVFYFFRFLRVRHRFYEDIADMEGPAAANQLRAAENPPWWNRLSGTGKVAYGVGAVALGLVVAMLRPAAGSGNFGARALTFVVIAVGLVLLLQFMRRP